MLSPVHINENQVLETGKYSNVLWCCFKKSKTVKTKVALEETENFMVIQILIKQKTTQ